VELQELIKTGQSHVLKMSKTVSSTVQFEPIRMTAKTLLMSFRKFYCTSHKR